MEKFKFLSLCKVEAVKKRLQTGISSLKQLKWKPKPAQIGLAVLALGLAGTGAAAGYYYVNVETIPYKVLLLTGQSYPLPEEGSIRFDTSEETPSVTCDETERTVTGQTNGDTHLQVRDFLTIYDYNFTVVSPKAQKEQAFTLTIDQSVTADKQPFIIPSAWASSDESVAMVDQNGAVTAVGSGSCEITETLNDFLAYTYTVNVTAPSVEQTSLVFYPDEEFSIPVDNYDGKVKWNIEGESVTQQKDGTFRTEKAGKATLTAKIATSELSVAVNVSEPLSVQENVHLMTTLHTTAQLKPENALDTVTYTSLDPTIATVDENGLVTPVAVGNTQIECTVRDQKAQTTVEVTEYTPLEALLETNYGDYQPKDATMGAIVMLGICAYYNDYMMDDKAKWYNSNTTDISDADTFDEMTDARKKGANCNKLTNWALKDMGLFPEGTSGIYGDSDNMIHYYNNHGTDLKKQVDQAFTVKELDGDDLSEFIDELEAGDVLFGHIHTYIYRGENTLFCSAGDAAHYNDSHGMVFINWLRNAKDTYNWSRPAYWMMRYKDSYIPEYYRNKDGDITKNPVYVAAHTNDNSWVTDEMRQKLIATLEDDILVDGVPVAELKASDAKPLVD